MSAGHTPGPWVAQKFEVITEPGSWAVYADSAPAGHKMPAVCYGPDAKSNARLIAAAPALADALEALLHDDRWPTEDEIDAAHAAIRLAGRL